MPTATVTRKRVMKLGSSLAVVLPKVMCDSLGISAGDCIDMTCNGGEIVTRKAPAAPNPATVANLAELFAGWEGGYSAPQDYPSAGNEIDWGEPVGAERA